MASVYKYGERVWSELLISHGGVRIGTLYDFRKSEHKRGIADATEGKKAIFHPVERYNSRSSRGIDKVAVDNLGSFAVHGNVDLSINSLTISRNFNSPDCYVHCTAHTLSREVLKQFEKADSCIEIMRPNAFYKHLTSIINKHTPVHFYGFHRIVYADRREKFNGENYGRRPDLIKDPEFFPQCEIRAIWIPKAKRPIEPFSVQEKPLRKFCREVEIL
jgi:hypothetical protein